MAQLALVGGGQILGSFLGGPIGAAIGGVVGSFAYQAFFAETSKTEGPRIGDRQVTTSAYGRLIPTIWGTFPVTGNVIDASEVREVSTTQSSGGKGGPPKQETTTYTYYGDLCVAVHDGPASLLQIRANGQLIYDTSATATIVKPDWLRFVWYGGSETQDPDPTFEGIHGTGDVPAYRGTSYIVFQDFNYSAFNNNFAINFEFLIVRSATTATALQDTRFAPVPTYSHGQGGAAVDPATGLVIFPNKEQNSYGSSGMVAISAIDPYSRSVVWQFTDSADRGTWFLVTPSPKLLTTTPANVYGPGNISLVCTDENDDLEYLITIDAASGTEISSAQLTGGTGPSVDAMDYAYYDSEGQFPYWIENNSGLGTITLFYGAGTSISIDPPTGWFYSGDMKSNGQGLIMAGLQDAAGTPSNYGVATLTHQVIIGSGSLSGDWGSVATLTGGPISGGVWAGDSWWVIEDAGPIVLTNVETDGTITVRRDWDALFSITATINSTRGAQGLVYDSINNYLWLESTAGLYSYDLNAQTDAPTLYTLSTGEELALIHEPTCRAWWSEELDGNAQSANLCALTPGSSTLDQVVSDLSTDDTELAAGDIDVTDLATETVKGFGITKPIARRNAIQSLRTAFLFDYVMRDAKLTGILRGNSSAATLGDDDIGAHIFGSQPPDPLSILTERSQNLPRQVEVSFVDLEKNYEIGTEVSKRQATGVGTIQRLELPVAFTHDDGAAVADIVLHLQHIESESYETQTMPSTIDDVQPAEVITISHNDESLVCRVVDAGIVGGRLLDVKALREVPEVYSSFAVGGTPREVNTTIRAVGETLLVMIDIPPVRSQDNDAGAYAAGTSYTPGWPGAELFESVDSSSYSSVLKLASDAALGFAQNAPTTGKAEFADTETELEIRLIAGTLAAEDWEDAIDAGNIAAWGAAGRWEIVGFATPTNTSANLWTISELQRGLFDTYGAVDSHEIGDAFILLDSSTLGRASYTAAQIGVERSLKPVTFGKLLEGTAQQSFTPTGEALRPWRPTRLHGARDGSNNWDLSWMRQDRFLVRPFWQPDMSEASESYTLDILGLAGNVIRTVTVSAAEEYEYTSADQVTDFGVIQTTIDWRVAQVSSAFGVGKYANNQAGSSLDYQTELQAMSHTQNFFTMDETTGTACVLAYGTGANGTYSGDVTLAQTPITQGSLYSPLFGGTTSDMSQANSLTATNREGLLLSIVPTALPSSGSAVIAAWSGNGVSRNQTVHLVLSSAGALTLEGWAIGGSAFTISTASSKIAAGSRYLIHAFHLLSNGNCGIYINNVSEATGTTGATFTNFSNAFQIGQTQAPSTGYGKYNGKIDFVSIHSGEIPSGDRSTLMTAGNF